LPPANSTGRIEYCRMGYCMHIYFSRGDKELLPDNKLKR